MSKRTLAIVLIGFVIAAIVGLIAWLYLTFRRPKPIQQPPPLSTQVEQTAAPVSTSTVIPSAPRTPPVNAGSPEERERLAQEALKRQAMSFAARVGSYSSIDEVEGIKSVYTDVTTDVRVFLESERRRLIREHPAAGPSWGQTTRSLSSKITSAIPVNGKNTAEVTVQVQQTIESASETNQVSYREVALQFKQSNGTWLVSRITWQPLQQP